MLLEMRVLLVDGDPSDARRWAQALRSSHRALDVQVASDDVMALSMLRREASHSSGRHVDLVLLDLGLPRGGGLRFLAEIKRDPALRRIPVVALAGPNSHADVASAYELHASVCFIKPVSGCDALAATILQVFGEAALPDEASAPRPVTPSVGDVTTSDRSSSRRLDELARANAELERFVHIVSHDLQEPLRMVASFTRLLEQEYSDRLDDVAREYIGFATDGSARMQRMLRDLLAYARLCRNDTVRQPVPAARALADAVDDLHLSIDESGAQVAWEALPTVWVVESELVKVFRNLIENAICFRGASSPRVRVSVQRGEAHWVFTVRDNGIGIAPEHAQVIFEPFRRLQPRSPESGTGMGLAVCKRIVECHGGRIWAESAMDDGSAFHFTLPASEPSSGPEPPVGDS